MRRTIRIMANLLMRRRIEKEITDRRGLPRGHQMHVSDGRLRGLAKVFDTRLTAVQRVESRFGGPKKPNSLSIEIDKAQTLRKINTNLEAMLDVMRYQVCFSAFQCHNTRVCAALTMKFLRLVSLGWTPLRLLLRPPNLLLETRFPLAPDLLLGARFPLAGLLLGPRRTRTNRWAHAPLPLATRNWKRNLRRNWRRKSWKRKNPLWVLKTPMRLSIHEH